jgi:transglutaminase-like putative cysteine protease
MKTEKNQGITFMSVPHLFGNKKENWFHNVISFLLSLLLLTSMVGSLLTMFNLEVNIPVLCLNGIFVTALCYLFCRLRKSRIFIVICACLFFIVILIFGYKWLYNGMAITINHILDVLECTFGRIYLPLSVSSSVSAIMAVTFFLALVTMVLAVFSTYLVCGQDKVILFLLLIVFITACLISVFSPFWLWYGLFFVSLALILLKQLLKVRGGQTQGRALAATGVGIVALTIATFLLYAMIFGLGSYEKPVFVSNIESNLFDVAERLFYGSDTTNNLPEGDFTKISALKLTDEAALRITMSQPESLYLRGYVGSVYTVSGWEGLAKKELYHKGNLFYWLHKDGFYGFSQLALAAKTAEEVNDNDYLTVSVTVIGAKNKYIYTPYEYVVATDSGALYRIGDLAPDQRDFDNKDTYTYETLTNQVKKSASLAQILSSMSDGGDVNVSSYLKDESYYREFVYENYLEVPSSDRKLFKATLGSYDNGQGNHADYGVAMQSILDYLLNNVTYDKNVSASPKGEDFLTYFLVDTAKGYAIHYATAAALMFRYYGIPARYVEGYIVTPEDVEGVKAEEQITLTGENAHAWVEYYQDGVGWVPFEVTPEYLFVMEQPDYVMALVSDELDDRSKEGSVSNKDQYEKQAEDKTSDDEADSVSPIFIVVVGSSSLLLLLLLFFSALVIRRGIVLKKRKRILALKTDKEAVDDLFNRSLTLLFASGLKKSNGSLDAYVEPLRQHASEGISLRFRSLAALHRESLFSDHSISNQRRQLFEAFQKEVNAHYKAKTRFLKRFKEKYIKNSY